MTTLIRTATSALLAGALIACGGAETANQFDVEVELQQLDGEVEVWVGAADELVYAGTIDRAGAHTFAIDGATHDLADAIVLARTVTEDGALADVLATATIVDGEGRLDGALDGTARVVAYYSETGEASDALRKVRRRRRIKRRVKK